MASVLSRAPSGASLLGPDVLHQQTTLPDMPIVFAVNGLLESQFVVLVLVDQAVAGVVTPASLV